MMQRPQRAALGPAPVVSRSPWLRLTPTSTLSCKSRTPRLKQLLTQPAGLAAIISWAGSEAAEDLPQLELVAGASTLDGLEASEAGAGRRWAAIATRRRPEGGSMAGGRFTERGPGLRPWVSVSDGTGNGRGPRHQWPP